MAGCLGQSGKISKMSIPLTGRLTISDNLAEFCAKRLQGTLGDPGPQAGQQEGNVGTPTGVGARKPEALWTSVFCWILDNCQTDR